METQAYQQADEAGKNVMLAAAQTSAVDEYSGLGKHPDQVHPGLQLVSGNKLCFWGWQ